MAIILITTGGAPRAEEPPNPVDLLFETSHWRAAPAGTQITYRYNRSGLEAVFGPKMEDSIRLSLAAGDTVADRTVRVEMFSAERRLPAGPFEAMEGNPVLTLFLEHHLGTLTKALKANPRYLKNAIRAALREKGRITPTTAKVGGEEVSGWSVVAQPFLDDANKARMRGLETLTYTFVTSPSVPGFFVSIEAKATGSDRANLFQESLCYDPAT